MLETAHIERRCTDSYMGMHAGCGHGMAMATSMAKLNMQDVT